jgi:esterase/lipase superfamily enzyme
MQKQAWTWTTPRLPQAARMVRWGHFGAPVLIFPTAGGDFEEIERFQLVAALGGLIDGGRIKVYSIDAVAARAWLAATTSVQECASLEKSYDTFLYEEVLQRIRVDCKDDHLEPILAGASLGAATAVITLCRHPDSFRAAIGLSGVYGGGAHFWRECCDAPPRSSSPQQTSPRDTSRRDSSTPASTPEASTPLASNSEASASQAISQISSLSPLRYVATLAGPQLAQLKLRRITLGSGAGDYENPADSKRLADALGSKGIACRFDPWGSARDHTWSTWRDLLPRLLAEQL